jgi:hypothetical protein
VLCHSHPGRIQPLGNGLRSQLVTLFHIKVTLKGEVQSQVYLICTDCQVSQDSTALIIVSIHEQVIHIKSLTLKLYADVQPRHTCANEDAKQSLSSPSCCADPLAVTICPLCSPMGSMVCSLGEGQAQRPVGSASAPWEP